MGEYRLSAINYSGETINNPEYILEFEVKLENPSDTELGAWEEPIP